MQYYNIEHPDYYYTHETESCDECDYDFFTKDGAGFFCQVNGKDHSFCCEQCMCNFFTPFFDEVGLYENGITALVKDYAFKCSHPDIFDLEWENYYDRSRNAML